MLTRGKLRSESFMVNMENFTQSSLAALEDRHVAERLQLILQPSVQEHLQPITDDLRNTLKDVQQTLGALQTIAKAKDQEILCLKREVNGVQDKLDNYEQQSRRGAIRVFGVPNDFPGTTDDVLLDLCNNKLTLQPPISLDEIEVSHRVGQLERIAPTTSVDGEVFREAVKPRPIIAKFIKKTLYNEHFSKRRVKTKYNNRKHWLSEGLKLFIHTKNKLYLTYVKQKCLRNEMMYKSYGNELNHTLRIAERNYYAELLAKHKNRTFKRSGVY